MPSSVSQGLPNLVDLVNPRGGRERSDLFRHSGSLPEGTILIYPRAIRSWIRKMTAQS